MMILDTDMFSLFNAGHPRVKARRAATMDVVAITLVTRIGALEGRFAFLLKAADGAELLRAQDWLRHTDAALALFPPLPFDAASAAVFDQLRENKKLRKIGRGDLLIAAITLAHRATLVTRNVKDFRQVPGLQVENWAD